jgi:hypothetical protein
MMENRIFTLCRMITWVVFLRMFWILSAAYRWREEDPFHFCCSRVIGLDMTENRIFTLCRTITWVVFLRMFWNFISSLNKIQNILRNTTQVIIRHRVKILFSIISSPITLEQQKWKLSKTKGILLSSPVNSWQNFKRF